MNLTLLVKMPDGSRYAVPVMEIARHRAKNYAHEFGGDVERSLDEDTMPLFLSDEYEILDWAANNMDWDDVERVARIVERPDEGTDFQEGWVNGPKEIIEENASAQQPAPNQARDGK